MNQATDDMNQASAVTHASILSLENILRKGDVERSAIRLSHVAKTVDLVTALILFCSNYTRTISGLCLAEDRGHHCHNNTTIHLGHYWVRQEDMDQIF